MEEVFARVCQKLFAKELCGHELFVAEPCVEEVNGKARRARLLIVKELCLKELRWKELCARVACEIHVCERGVCVCVWVCVCVCVERLYRRKSS